MIEKIEKKNGITIYYVKPDFTNEQTINMLDVLLKPKQIKTIIDHEADVIDAENGNLLLRFRKNKIPKETMDQFYTNVINFARKKTSNRGSSSGSKSKKITENPRIMTNIIGYFDKYSIYQKIQYRKLGIPLPKITVRPTYFVTEYPEKYKKLIPLIKEVDKYYKEYIPDKYEKQKKKANQTPCRIANTAFTTVTTNVNYYTAVHTDKGDDIEGFGNLTVIERGSYSGGETCFPQYSIGINVRGGDLLYMDVHQPHGNLPIKLETKDAERLSIVCYLRRRIWEQTKGKTRKWFDSLMNKTRKQIKMKGGEETII